MASAKKILIVDDNVDAADLTAEMLRLYGLEVDVAYGGPEGLAAAKATAPSVIFLDIGMPIMDGYQVATALRSDEAFRGVKIVALTAWGDAASRERSKAAGFDMHLTKPANLTNLLDIAQ
jgi:CheY-like chemotaxis protein